MKKYTKYPCRNCILSCVDSNGKSIPCIGKCENFYLHLTYLQQKRKYVPGKRIKTLNELMKQEFVFMGNSVYSHPKHISVIRNLSYACLENWIRFGRFYTAEKNHQEVK